MRATWTVTVSFLLEIGHHGVSTCTLHGSLATMDGTILDTSSSLRFVDF